VEWNGPELPVKKKTKRAKRVDVFEHWTGAEKERDLFRVEGEGESPRTETLREESLVYRKQGRKRVELEYVRVCSIKNGKLLSLPAGSAAEGSGRGKRAAGVEGGGHANGENSQGDSGPAPRDQWRAT